MKKKTGWKRTTNKILEVQKTFPLFICSPLFFCKYKREKKHKSQWRRTQVQKEQQTRYWRFKKLFQFIRSLLFFWKHKISNTNKNEIRNVNIITNIKGNIDTNVDWITNTNINIDQQPIAICQVKCLSSLLTKAKKIEIEIHNEYNYNYK